jgi:hypothetical protein
MGTDGHGNTEYDTSYAYGERSKLSKPKMGIFINKENNKHPCAGAQRSKLSKPKTRSVVDKEDNTNNHSVAPTLCHGEGIYLSTMKTI